MAANNNDDKKSPKPNVGEDQDSAVPSGAAEAAGTAEAETERLKAENAELLDRLLRSAAETENMRKRGERTTDEARKYAISDFAREMLTVADNLDRAAVVDGHAHRAGIRAIVRTDGAGEFSGSVHVCIEGLRG